MLEYLVLGIGLFLVFVSVIYTHRVDRRVNNFPDHIENVPIGKLYDVNSNSTRPTAPVEHQDNQLKDSINTIGGELDDLIQELRDKEQEIKQIVQKARKWDSELSDPVFAELMKKKLRYQNADKLVQNLNEEVAVVDEEETTGENASFEEEQIVDEEHKSEPNSDSKVVPNKYDNIKKLADEGLSITEIAKQLNLGYREVELVVKMSKKGADTGA